METWTQRLERNGILVSDGAWGTEFARMGMPSEQAPELWNIERPDDVLKVARSYVEAGADIILTNSFGGNPFKLEKRGLAERVAQINRRAAEISKEAAGERAFVFASMGPTGEFMEPLGPASEASMVAAFAEQARALAEGGADGVVVESLFDLNEARAALHAVKNNTGLPCVVSMSFDKGPAGYATMMGVKPAQAAEALERAGADAVGANCGAGPDEMVEVAGLMRPATGLPLWFKPNAGLPELIGGETVYRQTPEEMAGKSVALAEAGARIVGGCCGSRPEHIAAIAEEMRRRRA